MDTNIAYTLYFIKLLNLINSSISKTLNGDVNANIKGPAKIVLVKKHLILKMRKKTAKWCTS